MTFFLALKTEEASSMVANPQLCGPGRKYTLHRKEALASPQVWWLTHQPTSHAFCVSPVAHLKLYSSTL